MKRLILTLFALLIVFVAHAQTSDIITTKTGDTYEGYISRQIPGKELTIHSNKTTLTVAKYDAEVTRKRESMLGDLPEEYVSLFPNLADDSSVKIADIIVTQSDGGRLLFKNSVIIEEGEDIKFASFSEHPFDLKWSLVSASEKVPVDFSKQTGIIDKLILPDAEILEGQLIGQNLVTGLFKFRTKDGGIMSLKKSEVQAIRFEPIDQEQEIWTQTPFLDRVLLKNGSSIEGFIQSKVFGNHITLLSKSSGEVLNIKVQDISSYEKYPNTLYKEPEEVIHQEILADLYINGISSPMRNLERNKSSFYVSVPVDSLTSLKTNKNIVIKFKAKTRTNEVKLAKTKLKKERVFGLSGSSINKRGTELWPVFSKSDIVVENGMNFQSNDGEYIVVDITFAEPGVYVIWVEDSNVCIPLNVKSY